MSMIKRYIEDVIDKLADETGYDYCFLMDKYLDYWHCEDPLLSLSEAARNHTL